MEGKILIIKSKLDSFDEIVNEKLTKAGCEVIDGGNLISAKNKIKRICASLKMGKWIIQQGYDKIIIFDYDTLYFIFKFIFGKKINCYLWFWNTISSYSISNFRVWLYRKMNTIYTFDENDVRTYGLKYNTQFYLEWEKHDCAHILQDVYFVGVDKGRYELVRSISNYFDENEITYKFQLLPEKDKIYDKSQIICKNFVPYKNVIDNIRCSNVILDLCKPGQSGMTFRVMEALFFNKKIITNNREYIRLKFYDKRNIFILGYDDFKKLKDFVSSKSECFYEDKIKEYYSISNWINRFC